MNFWCGNYSREVTIQERKLYEEICNILIFFIPKTVYPSPYENQLFTGLCHQLWSTYLLILFSLSPVCIKEPRNLPAHIYNSSIRKHGRPRTFFHNIIHKCRASCNYLRHIQVFLGRSPEKDSTQTRRKVSPNEVYIFALSFFRSQNVLCRSKFFEPTQKFDCI